MSSKSAQVGGLLLSVLLLASSCGSGPQSRLPGTTSSQAPISSTGTAPVNVYSAEPELGTYLVAPGTRGIICDQWVVLATDRLAYSPDEIRQMSSFDKGDVFAKGGPVPAALLRKAGGVLTDARINTWVGAPNCHVHLQITNTASGALQIPQVGWRLTGQPQRNQEQYRLVDLCSQNAELCGIGSGGGALGCGHYSVRITLTNANAGSDQIAAPTAVDEQSNPCPPITLNPGQSIEISSWAVSADPLTFSVEPVLALNLSGSNSMLALSDMAGNMPFASPSQFACYRVQGSKLVQAWSGVAALDHNARQADSAWCL